MKDLNAYHARMKAPPSTCTVVTARLMIRPSTSVLGPMAVADDTQPHAAVDLRAAQCSEFSQHGEDGVIEKIFEIIEPGPKFCVEFGAFDGIHNSNMRNLIVNHG